VTSWLQHAGSLTVAGNSKTVRIWDVGKEQCSRIFHTGVVFFWFVVLQNVLCIDFSPCSGHETCVTVLNAKTISSDLNLNYSLSVQASKENAGGGQGGMLVCISVRSYCV
jgi:WD40 repeat protein